MSDFDLWRGLRQPARAQLSERNYSLLPIEERVARAGMECAQVLASERALREAGAWIPGVELFHRTIYAQRHRGVFGELARDGEGVLGRIGLKPRQWAAAHMFSGTAKGFHIHPPHIPADVDPAQWFQRLFVNEPENFALRPYSLEQWDVMFFLAGRAEMLLSDERDGLPRKKMRLFIDGDNHRGPNTFAVVIPAGVAHAIRSEGSEDLVMTYGTTTVFQPANEGRIASDVELAPLPPEWEAFFQRE